MRKVLTLLVLMVATLVATAQTKSVTGKVTDEGGKPIPGASIVIKGKNGGTSTDVNGGFTLTVKQGDVLVASAVGFTPFQVKIINQASVAFQLTSTNVSLEEVVVTTAGGVKTKKREIGTANTQVKGDALTAGKAVSIAAGLQGKVAGLQIDGTSSGVNPSYRLVLRGQRSITGNNQALIVLDNAIVPSSILGNLNPEDVEDVVVLNGAGAAALYGSQASNGAIVVTTKKGKKGASSLVVSNTTTVESVAFFPKIQKKFGSGGTAYGLDANGNPLFNYLENQSYGPAFDGIKRPLGAPLEDGSQDSAYYAYNDGHDKFWQKGVTNQTNFSLSNADDKSSFYLSGQYASITGTTPGDNYNRATLRANGTRKISNTISSIYTIAYTQNRYDITSVTSSVYSELLNMPSNVDITKYKNWRTDKFANPNGFYNPWYLNPYFAADNYRSKQRNDYLTGNVELKFTPITGLDFIARQSITTRNYSNKYTTGQFIYTYYAKHTDQSSKADISAAVSDGSYYTTALLSDVFAQYEKKKGAFSFYGIAGGQWTQNEAKNVDVSSSGLVVPNLYNVSTGVGTPGASESNYKARQIGAYGKVRLGYKNYLFAEVTGRNDWTSILNADNNAFFYPSVNFSFVASDAIAAIKHSNVINYLKVRGGWSKVGQVNLGTSSDFGAYYTAATSGQASGFPYGSTAGFTVGNGLVAPNLKPEITRAYEFGFDLNLLKDRITTNVTWYTSKTDNQTVTTNISNATGYTTLRTNVGQTQSTGLELAASFEAVKTRDWNVTVGGNYTYLDNKVNFISAAVPKISLSTSGSAVSFAAAGLAFPTIFGYDYVRDPAGHVIVNATTGLPTKTSGVINLGSGVANNKLGLNAAVTYKNIHLTVLFEYRGGAKIFNGIGTELDWSGTGYRTAVYDRKSFVFPNSVYEDPSKPGTYITNTKITIANGNGNNGFWTDDINRGVTSNYVTSADFWKLREIALSYDLPQSILAKTKFVKGASISLQGRNLFMWLAKDNIYTDPEYSSGGSDSNGIGLNSLSQTPPSRFYGATVTFKF